MCVDAVDINPALDMGQQHLLSLILDSNSDGKIQMGDQLFVVSVR